MDGQLQHIVDDNMAISDFVVSLLADKIKKDGKSVGRDQAQKRLDELKSKDGGQFAAAAKKVVEDKYRGQQLFSDRVGKLRVRFLGLYPPVIASRDFHYVSWGGRGAAVPPGRITAIPRGGRPRPSPS